MSVPDPPQAEELTPGQSGPPIAGPLRPLPVVGAGRPLPKRGAKALPTPPGAIAGASRPIPVSTPKPDPLAVQDNAPDEDEEDQELDVSALLGNSPPWLVSLVVHLVLLVVLGLIGLAAIKDDALTIKITTEDDIWAEDLGEQVEEVVRLTTKDTEATESIVSDSPLPPVDDPLSSPPDSPPQENATAASSELNYPDVGNNLNGRERGRRSDLLGAYGGNRLTEEAVLMALEWLARQQKPDGSWSLIGPYSDGAAGDDENTTAATAMALIAFQGFGVTHQKPKKPRFMDQAARRAYDAAVKFQPNVARGWQAMLKLLNKNGNFAEGTPAHQYLYAHAQAVIAICELYGMTKDPKYKQPAERAVAYSLKAQGTEGGWRYLPGGDSDVSVTGWFVIALQSARMAKIDVPEKNLDRISKFLDRVAIGGGSQYRYREGSHTNSAMTAEGLLCRQYLGWKQDDARLLDGANYVVNRTIDYRLNHRNVYYWYYATQYLHHLGNPYWHKWNKVMLKTIPTNQTTKGKERGSWDPNGDLWGPSGGRLYVTCLSTYMLEVYYRHLPIYQKLL